MWNAKQTRGVWVGGGGGGGISQSTMPKMTKIIAPSPHCPIDPAKAKTSSNDFAENTLSSWITNTQRGKTDLSLTPSLSKRAISTKKRFSNEIKTQNATAHTHTYLDFHGKVFDNERPRLVEGLLALVVRSQVGTRAENLQPS